MSLIALQPDPNIEPGHQWIVLEISIEGNALAKLLTGENDVYPFLSTDLTLRIPHNYTVDQNIVKLIDDLAHMRFSAPGLVQMTMTEAQEVQG